MRDGAGAACGGQPAQVPTALGPWDSTTRACQPAGTPPPTPPPSVSDLAFSETNTTTSSWDGPPIEAGSQTFLARPAVVGLSATRSGRGNTAKQVMLLTTTGGVGGGGAGGTVRPCALRTICLHSDSCLARADAMSRVHTLRTPALRAVSCTRSSARDFWFFCAGHSSAPPSLPPPLQARCTWSTAGCSTRAARLCHPGRSPRRSKRPRGCRLTSQSCRCRGGCWQRARGRAGRGQGLLLRKDRGAQLLVVLGPNAPASGEGRSGAAGALLATRLSDSTTCTAPHPSPPRAPRSPMFATMDRQVARLAGVATQAAVLESTMLLAAHGLDLFYTRVMPSRQAPRQATPHQPSISCRVSTPGSAGRHLAASSAGLQGAARPVAVPTVQSCLLSSHLGALQAPLPWRQPPFRWSPSARAGVRAAPQVAPGPPPPPPPHLQEL